MSCDESLFSNNDTVRVGCSDDMVANREFNAHESDIAVCSSLLNLKLDVEWQCSK